MKSKDFYKLTAWKWFSKYMKLQDANTSNGNCLVRCSTCDKWIDLTDDRKRKLLHLGHFIKVFDGNSTNFSTAFDERNVSPQCYQCNRFFGGRPDIMRNHLVIVYGKNEMDKLEIKSKKWFKLDKVYLDEIAKEYRLKYNELVQQIGFNPFK